MTMDQPLGLMNKETIAHKTTMELIAPTQSLETTGVKTNGAHGTEMMMVRETGPTTGLTDITKNGKKSQQMEAPTGTITKETATMMMVWEMEARSGTGTLLAGLLMNMELNMDRTAITANGRLITSAISQKAVRMAGSHMAIGDKNGMNTGMGMILEITANTPTLSMKIGKMMMVITTGTQNTVIYMPQISMMLSTRPAILAPQTTTMVIRISTPTQTPTIATAMMTSTGLVMNTSTMMKDT